VCRLLRGPSRLAARSRGKLLTNYFRVLNQEGNGRGSSCRVHFDGLIKFVLTCYREREVDNS
jgi:hypothetical protein